MEGPLTVPTFVLATISPCEAQKAQTGAFSHVLSTNHALQCTITHHENTTHPHTALVRRRREGGIRVNAFAFGGFLDPTLAGTVTEELIEVADWWTTFSILAGANTTDESAAAAGLPAPDGVDVSGLFVRGGNRTSPREYIVIGDTDGDSSSGNTTVGGILRRDGWKLLQGHIGNPLWQGPIFPNKTSCPTAPSLHCNPCLFQVFLDPHELHDVSQQQPAIVAELTALLEKEKKKVFSPWRGVSDPAACSVALRTGFWGPFLD